jgi:hypothetical protein
MEPNVRRKFLVISVAGITQTHKNAWRSYFVSLKLCLNIAFESADAIVYPTKIVSLRHYKTKQNKTTC